MKTNCSIFIATPMYGGQCSGLYMCSLLDLTHLLSNSGIGWQFRLVYNDALITRARNFMVHEFLNYSDCTHIMFIDSDIQFNAEDVLSMLDANKHVICGAYPCKHIKWETVTDLVNKGVVAQDLSKLASDYVHNGTNVNVGGNSIKTVGNAGTGFMLIKREVFEALAPTVASYTSTEFNRYPGETIKLFFDTSVDQEHQQYLSEDYHFCKLWREYGGQINIAEWVQLKHIGMYIFGQ